MECQQGATLRQVQRQITNRDREPRASCLSHRQSYAKSPSHGLARTSSPVCLVLQLFVRRRSDPPFHRVHYLRRYAEWPRADSSALISTLSLIRETVGGYSTRAICGTIYRLLEHPVRPHHIYVQIGLGRCFLQLDIEGPRQWQSDRKDVRGDGTRRYTISETRLAKHIYHTHTTNETRISQTRLDRKLYSRVWGHEEIYAMQLWSLSCLLAQAEKYSNLLPDVHHRAKYKPVGYAAKR